MPTKTSTSYDPTQSTGDLRDALVRVAAPEFQFHASPQEDALARAYAIHHDASRAWLDSGYPPLATRSDQSSAAYRLLETDRLAERLDYYHRLQKARLDIRDDRLMAEVAAIAFSDVADVFDPETGKIRALHDIPKHARAAIRSVKVRETEDLLEDGTTRIRRQVELAMWDKPKALDLAAKVKGMYHDPTRNEPPKVIMEVPKQAAQVPPAQPTQATQPTPTPKEPEEHDFL